ncbi:CDPK-related kinase 3-like [Iris pallida]|uniref:CDPK-related kinase 3-like n=1 Tax=Iris pallida TaxID=29817 RepID=A0AAX6H2M7_IRIPA|nr:CDPK-related kinase 3-like [Iris pallida]
MIPSMGKEVGAGALRAHQLCQSQEGGPQGPGRRRQDHPQGQGRRRQDHPVLLIATPSQGP